MKIRKSSILYLGYLLLFWACQSEKNDTNGDIRFMENINPGKYDSSWWNRAPVRLIQTNLREIDANMDREAYIQSMVDASASVVLLNIGGIVANYPTDLPFHYQNTFMEGDLVGDLIEGLHRKGIKVIGRFDFSKINEVYAKEKPEWLYVGAHGKNVSFNGQVHTCINGEYQQQYSLDILEEAITKYPLDGIFFNMIGYTTSDYSGEYHGICQCQNCKSRFKEETAMTLPLQADMQDPVFRRYNEFKKTTSDELFRKINEHIKGLDPGLMIMTYTDAGVDMITSESGASLSTEYEWNYHGTDNVKRVLGSYQDLSPMNLLIYFQAIGYRHVGTSPNLARTWMLENMLNAAPLGFVVIGTLEDYEDRIFFPTLHDIYGFHQKHEKLFTNMESRSKVGLIRGGGTEYRGLIKMLNEAHIPFDIIDPIVIGTGRNPRSLIDYEALILGDVRNMDENLVAAFDNYVMEGGRLLVTGFTATNDGTGAPLNALRLESLGLASEFEKIPQSRSTYLKVSDTDKTGFATDKMGEFSIMMMYSDFLKCSPNENTKGYFNLLSSTMFGPPEKSYFTEDEITDVPGAFSNAYGNGQTVFFPWLLGTSYYQKGHYIHKRVFEASLKDLLGVSAGLETNASPMVEMTQMVNKEGAFEWIGMINHSGQIGASVLEPVPMRDIFIRFQPQKEIKELRLLRSGEKLDFTVANGWVECNIPELNDFEMLLAVY